MALMNENHYQLGGINAFVAGFVNIFFFISQTLNQFYKNQDRIEMSDLINYMIDSRLEVIHLYFRVLNIVQFPKVKTIL